VIKVDSFDTAFETDPSSIGNVEDLLGIEPTSRLYKRVCWVLNSRMVDLPFCHVVDLVLCLAQGDRHLMTNLCW